MIWFALAVWVLVMGAITWHDVRDWRKEKAVRLAHIKFLERLQEQIEKQIQKP